MSPAQKSLLDRAGRARSGNGHAPRRPSAVHSAFCEHLEDRTLFGVGISWDGGGDGTSWHDPLNWSTNQIPTVLDDVTINVAPNPTITFTSTTGARSVNSLICAETINFTGGNLTVVTTSTLLATATLNGGTLTGGTWDISGGTLQFSGSANTISGLTINGDMSITGPDSLGVTGGLTYNGTLTINPAAGTAALAFNGGTQTLGGTGTIALSIGSAVLSASAGAVVTIGPAITVSGRGSLSQGFVFGGTGGFINQGLISANTSGQILTLNPLTLGFSNTGLVRAVSGGILALTGTYTTAQLGDTRNISGTVRLTGTINNTAATLTLNATTGSWTSAGGTINSGSLTLTGGSTLLVSGSLTANALTINGDMSITGPDSLGVTGGLTYNGTLTINPAGGTATLAFNGGTQTLGGTGTIALGITSAVLSASAGAVVTIGPGIIVSGQGSLSQGLVFGGTGGFINQGLISANTSGQILTLNPLTLGFSNTGLVRAVSGGILALTGTYTTAQLGDTRNVSGTVRLTGTITNTATTLTLNATTGSWTSANGTINGGTVTLTGGSTLLIVGSLTANALTINGDMSITTGATHLLVTGGMTYNGTLTVNPSGGTSAVAFNGGTQTLGGTGTIALGIISAVLSASAGAVVTIGPGITVSGQGSLSQGLVFGGTGGFINQGLISANTSGQTILINTLALGFSNTGTAQATGGGLLNITASLTNLSSGTLTGGTWRVVGTSTLTTSGGSISATTASTTILLDGSGATWAALNSLTTNGGSLTLANGRAFNFTPAGNLFTNSGPLIKTGTGSATIAASITLNNTGTVNATGGTLTVAGPVSQVVGGALTAGTWLVSTAATLDLSGANITVNNATVALAGTANFIAFNALATNNGTITLSNAHPFSFTPAGGVFANTGEFLVTGVGGIHVPATVAFNNSGASVHVQGGALWLDGGGTQTGHFDVAAGAKLYFSGGTTSLTGTSTVTGAGDVFFQAPSASVAGLVTITGKITVASGTATLTAPGSTAATLANTAGLTLGSVATLSISGNAANDGTISLQGGHLSVLGGGSHTGDILLTASGQLTLGGNHAFAAGADITGTGSFEFVSGTSVMSGAVNITGTALFTGTSETFGSTFHAGAIVISPPSTVSFSGATDATSLQDDGTLSMVGPGGTLLILGDSTLTGTTTLSGGAAVTFTGTTTFTGSASVTGSGIIINNGTLIRTGAGTTSISSGVTFDNPGTVEVFSGTLALNGPVPQVQGNTLTGGTWCGTDPGTLSLAGATITTNNAFIMLSGANSIFAAISGLTTNNGWFTIANGRNFTAATFTNSATGILAVGNGSILTITGAFTNNGTVSLPGGTLRALSGGTHTGDFLLVSGGTSEFAGNHVLTPTADVTGGGNLTFSGGTSTIGGTVNITGTARFDGNNETFNGNFTAATTIVAAASQVTFNATTAAGALSLTGGALSLGAAATVSAASVSNGGSITLGLRTLTVTGTYIQTGPGTLSANIGSASGYGRISAGTGSTVAGTLTVALINGFAPAHGNRFDVVSGGAGTVTGAFGSVNAPPPPTHDQWAPRPSGGQALQMIFTWLGDADLDGLVTPADVATFINTWFSSLSQGTLAGDFDHNGFVEPADVAGFVAEWFYAATH